MKIPTLKQIQTINLTDLFDAHVVSSTHKSYFLDVEGREHYKLLAAISTNAAKGSTLIDLGTYKGLSALALSYNHEVNVVTYDISDVALYDHIVASRSNIEFRKLSCFDDIEFIAKSDFIFLDIDPHDGNQEARFIEELSKTNYKGVVICDDIHLNDKMRSMWKELKHEKKDITHIGHSTGTGLIFIK